MGKHHRRALKRLSDRRKHYGALQPNSNYQSLSEKHSAQTEPGSMKK